MQEGQVTVGDETVVLPDHLLGPRHPEPDRARGDLSAPRGPARPVPDEADGRLPRPRRRAGDARPARRRPAVPTRRPRPSPPPCSARPTSCAFRGRAAVGPGRAGDQGVRRRPRPRHPRPGRATGSTSPRCSSWGEPARHARPGPRRAGPRPALRAATTSRRTTSRSCPRRPPPPDPRQLRGRRRGARPPTTSSAASSTTSRSPDRPPRSAGDRRDRSPRRSASAVSA